MIQQSAFFIIWTVLKGKAGSAKGTAGEQGEISIEAIQAAEAGF